ncbi:kelch repeat-containing protein [Streptomyces mirabilis]|uniref:kelch repeat-containing protein n=1 Tax=Streptomyces mirabilis TaxID=68239 RepID=UPI003320455D
MHDARFSPTATRLPNGKVLVAGGSGTGSNLASAELYDPRTGRWALTGSMHDGRSAATAALLPNGKVLVAGGLGDTGILASAELYNPRTGRWSVTDSMHDARFEAPRHGSSTARS